MRGTATTWAPPTQFEEYRILRQLGAGSMGRVFLAHDTVLDRQVALKFLGSAHLNGPSRERFVGEARALARLHHPNVVGVYRIGDFEERPYLVSEFVEGRSLDNMPKPADWKTVLRIAVAVCRGLDAAHKAGILHRDIKPANIMMTQTGDVKLLDFGLAKMIQLSKDPWREEFVERTTPLPSGFDWQRAAPQSVAPGEPTPLALNDTMEWNAPHNSAAGSLQGAVVGTPAYVAPELWSGAPATPASEIYALGTTLFTLLVGANPHRGHTVEAVAISIVTSMAPSVASCAPDIDPRFAAIIDRCLSHAAKDRYASAGDLLQECERLLAQLGAPAPTVGGKPYPGMQPFTAAQRAMFFGREADIGTVIDRCRNTPFLAIAGDAGVGKTSFCDAGLGPSIEHGALGLGRTWHVATLHLRNRPLTALSEAIARLPSMNGPAIEAALGGRDSAALDKLRHDMFWSLGKDHGLFFIIDSLEDLVTQSDMTSTRTFCEFLHTLVNAGGNSVRVVVTLRTDYLTQLASLPALGELVGSSLHLLKPLTAEQVRRAVVEPATAHNARFEPPSIVDDLVDAATSSGIALVQFALAELWETRGQPDVINGADFTRSGGIAGALQRHADSVYQAIPSATRTHVRELLMAMVGADRTPVARSARELKIDGPTGEQALEHLIRGRLVSAVDGDDGVTYRLYHARLISDWPRLRDWLDEDGDQRLIRRRVEDAAAEWSSLGRATPALWQDQARLAASSLVAVERLSPLAADFLQQSQRYVRNRRRLRWGIASALVVAALTTFLVVRYQVQTAADRRSAELARVRNEKIAALVAESQALTATGPNRAAVEAARTKALEIFDSRDLAAGDVAWAKLLADVAALDQRLAQGSQPLEHALVLDGSRRDVRAALAEKLHDRAWLADTFHHREQRDEFLQRLELYDTDNTYLSQWKKPGSITWNIDPPGATIRYAKITPVDGRRVEGPMSPYAPGTTLAPGSYVFEVSAPERSTARYPLMVANGKDQTVQLRLLRPEQIPPGFVYVPGGTTLIGSNDEAQRSSFFYTVPMHERHVDSFLIAKHETTFGEWIEFLESLPPEERNLRRPKSDEANDMIGVVDLLFRGGWELLMRPGDVQFRVRDGQPLLYEARKQNRKQDWRKLPVVGLSIEDADAFGQWLNKTGRVNGARLCTELEWERAARGNDDRIYPHGDVLLPTDANFDETYGKNPLAFGPDAVGLWPQSNSPFDIVDLAGNVFEWSTLSLSGERDLGVMRGGAFYFGRAEAQIANRTTLPRTFRSNRIGFRLCAVVRN